MINLSIIIIIFNKTSHRFFQKWNQKVMVLTKKIIL